MIFSSASHQKFNVEKLCGAHRKVKIKTDHSCRIGLVQIKLIRHLSVNFVSGVFSNV
jgi:hypothetical protein